MIAAHALDLPARTGSDYPAPHNAPYLTRVRRALGDAFGLSQFGVNLLDLPPGTWSSQRHWHEHQDEFVYVLEGEIVLARVLEVGTRTVEEVAHYSDIDMMVREDAGGWGYFTKDGRPLK